MNGGAAAVTRPTGRWRCGRYVCEFEFLFRPAAAAMFVVARPLVSGSHGGHFAGWLKRTSPAIESLGRTGRQRPGIFSVHAGEVKKGRLRQAPRVSPSYWVAKPWAVASLLRCRVCR